MLPLSTPTFAGLPNAPVKEVDVYKDVDTGLANKLTSKISAFDTDLNSIVGGATKMVKGIGTAMQDRGIDLPTAKNRIRDALGGSRSAISDIAETLERSISGDLTGTDEGTGYVRGANTMIDSVKLVMNGVDQTFLNSDYKSVSGIMGFISDLAGNQLINVFDLGAQAALVKGILSEVSAWGIPDIIDETFGAKWNEESRSYDYTYNDEFRFSVTKRASDSLSPSTSLNVIERLMLHGGSKALVAENPAYPDQLLSGYVIPEGCVAGGPYPVVAGEPHGAQTQPNYYDEGRRLINILNELKPGWFYANRQVFTGNAWRTDPVWNLQYLTSASEGARLVMATDAKVRIGLMVAPFYRIEPGLQMLKTMYPYFIPGQA